MTCYMLKTELNDNSLTFSEQLKQLVKVSYEYFLSFMTSFRKHYNILKKFCTKPVFHN